MKALQKGGFPPELQSGIRVPVIPKEIQDAQKAYVEKGKFIASDLEEIITNEETKEEVKTICEALQWIIQGQLPIDI